MIPLLDVTSLMTTTPEQLFRWRSSTPSRQITHVVYEAKLDPVEVIAASARS